MQRTSDKIHLSSRIKVGPPNITIHEGNTFMVTDASSGIQPGEELGLFAEDTRLVSAYKLLIDKKPWTHASSAAVSFFGASFLFLSPEITTPDGTKEPGKIELRLQRRMSRGAVHEEAGITNHFQGGADFEFAIEIESDFADIFEVKRHQVRQREIDSVWSQERSELYASYKREDFQRGAIYRINKSDSKPHFANGKLHFGIKLKAGETWRLDADIIPVINGDRREPGDRQQGLNTGSDRTVQQEWHDSATRIETPNEGVRSAFAQSVYDIGALRLDANAEGQSAPMPAAGTPWFMAVFGRDSLIVALQSMLVRPHLARGTLKHLAKYQAKERDDWRDAQPGKIVHEMRYGEVAHFNESPHGPYYGTADASILFLIVLSEAFRWTGDRSLIAENMETAKKCIGWIDNYGDLDGDGFQEYKTFSAQGYHNMGWKDSGVAVLYPDGSQVQQPIATCELQGLVYDAKQRMAEIFDVAGDPARAGALRSQAETLKQKFNEAFWMEDEGFYAFALDPDKKQVRSIASNPGQLLLTGIVDKQDRARKVIHRLLQPDMYSGWGIRTLSKNNPAYDPNAYQLGSVWPHDNAWIAAGAKRYGLWEEANIIAKGIFDAAENFQMYRLPELFAGADRDRDGFPIQYLGANIPQAWAAGSIFMLLRAILGVEPREPGTAIDFNPTLPDWLPEATLKNLSFGEKRMTVRFSGQGESSSFEVLEGSDGTKINGKVAAA